jgi:hypothetical protein
LESLISELQLQRDIAITSAKESNEQKATIERRLQQSKPKTTVDNLIDREYRQKRLSEIQAQLGSTYKIIEAALEMDTLDFCGFIRRHHLTERTVNALSKFLPGQFPTLHQIRRTERELVQACGDFTCEQTETGQMIWATDPRKLFRTYFDRLMRSAWNNIQPTQIQLILSGDKGSLISCSKLTLL